MEYHPEEVPHICSAHPTFHDSCPQHSSFCNQSCSCAQLKKKRTDPRLDVCYGRHLHQPGPDFCYNDKLAHKSLPAQRTCGLDSGKKKANQGRKHESECNLCCKNRSAGSKKPGRKRSGDSFTEETDRRELKKKLEECIKRFNEGSPETVHKLEVLRNFLNTKIIDEECFPQAEWPHCPVKEGPEAFEVPHPYLPRMTMWTKPQTRRNVLKVTVDGRLGEQYRPKKFYHEEPPLNVPPWVLPRYKSQELRGGKLYSGCKCWRKNGIQDDCERWDCAGRPECREKPWPICPPSMNPPIGGVRKPNLYHGKPPTCAKQKPPPPYPEPDIYSLAHVPPPFAPAIPCPLNDDIS